MCVCVLAGSACTVDACVQGVYVLQDTNFRWTKYVSGAPGEDMRALALKYTIFPCGLIRGALAAFDMDVTVNVEVSNLPKVLFQISLKDLLPPPPPGGVLPASAASAAAPGAP